MIMEICCVKDLAIQSFLQPMFVTHRGQAMRSFQDEVARVADDNAMSKHPEDFELYLLGTFDTGSGLFESAAGLLLRGKDVKSS